MGRKSVQAKRRPWNSISSETFKGVSESSEQATTAALLFNK